MNLHLDYAFHPLLLQTVLRRFGLAAKKAGRSTKLYLRLQETKGLLLFLNRARYRLKTNRIYLFAKADQLNPRLVHRLDRVSKELSLQLIVDLANLAPNEDLVNALRKTKMVVSLSHCPTPIEGLKCFATEEEETLGCLEAILCSSPVNYLCRFSSCLGNTVYVDEKGDCRNCYLDEAPFGNVRERDIADKLRDNPTLNALLEQEVPFRDNCMKTCVCFPYCKGYCPKEKERCLYKAIQPKAVSQIQNLGLDAENTFDLENAIYRASFHK